MPEHDVVIVGLGAMGSAAAYQLARRGQRVLGIDAYPAGHTFGSSHGETRIIRMAYFEHPDYVPLLRRAYQLWDELAAAATQSLLHRTGGLFIGPPEGQLVAGSRRSALMHHVPHEMLDAGEIRRRFPVLHARPDEVALFEADAGVLYPERCIAACLELAEQAGATLRHAEPVISWTTSGDGVRIQTPMASYEAGQLVLTAGAWLGKLLAALDLPLQPERIPLFWFSPRAHAEQFELGAMPIWIWDDGAFGHFFTTPHIDWPGVKIGKHHSRQNCDPDTVDRTVSAADEQPLRSFLERCVPDLAGPVAASRVCLYTNTPDEHFLIDRHPIYRNVVYAGGFSGHGFKFASVVGEILADLVTVGQATPDAAFLRAERFSDLRSSGGASR